MAGCQADVLILAASACSADPFEKRSLGPVEGSPGCVFPSDIAGDREDQPDADQNIPKRGITENWAHMIHWFAGKEEKHAVRGLKHPGSYIEAILV